MNSLRNSDARSVFSLFNPFNNTPGHFYLILFTLHFFIPDIRQQRFYGRCTTGKIDGDLEPVLEHYAAVNHPKGIPDGRTRLPSSLYETFTPEEAKRIRDRFEFIFTPRHGSWLNMAEIELHVLNGQCLNRHIATMDKVKSEVEAWQNCRNNKDAKINWQFTKEDAGIKLKRLYPIINT